MPSGVPSPVGGDGEAAVARLSHLGFWMLIMLAASAAGASGVEERLLFRSDFTQDTLAQYEVLDPPDDESHWYVWGGALKQNKSVFQSAEKASDGLRNPYLGTLALVRDVSAADCSFTAVFRTGSTYGIGIVARYRGPGSFYRLVSCAAPSFGGPVTRLERWTDGEMALLGWVEGTAYHAEAPNVMRLELKGSEIRAYLNDLETPLLAATDTAHASGAAGLSLYRTSDVSFTELRLAALLTLPPLPAGRAPVLAALSASSAQPGAVLFLAGEGFEPGLSQIRLNGHAVEGLFPTSQQAVFQVPLGLAPGHYDVTVSNGARVSGKLVLTVPSVEPLLAPLASAGACPPSRDINGDGQLTVADVIRLLRLVTGLGG